MDRDGTSVKKERHELIEITSVPVIETSQTTVIKCEMSDTPIDLTEDEKFGLAEPRSIKSDVTAIPGRLERNSLVLDVTTHQDTADVSGGLLSGANIGNEPQMGHSQDHSAEPLNETGNKEEHDVHDLTIGSSESENDDETKDRSYVEGSEKLATKKSKNRQAPAKTAREFFARLHEKEQLLRQEQAKKNGKTQIGSGKARAPKKLTMGANLGSGMVAQLQRDVHNGENIRESVSTSMPEMSTCTHAEQLAIISSSIPAGSDTRRSKTQKRDLRQAIKSFGYKALKALDGKWLHRDMETPLYSYQVTATSWMMGRELAKAGPLGGIIADDMGMGKTLMSLACIVGNPPDEADNKEYFGKTLVIVPNVAVAEQWRKEAMKHLSRRYTESAMVYSAKWCWSSQNLEQYSIIITTMHEIRQQFHSVEANKAMQKESLPPDMACNRQKSCQLFELNWYRIILDEAHAIQNVYSKSKEACCSLKAKHRWALTGTPLSNRTTEFLSYLKFIGCNMTENLKAFKNSYMDEDKANEKLEALISMVMYRRTKNDTFFGHKILDIPQCHTKDIHFSLSQEEQLIYSFTKSIFGKLAKDIETEQSVKTEKTDEEATKEPEVQLRAELALIYMEQQMHLRMVLSHSYNVENLYRTMPSGAAIRTLRQALVDLPTKRTVIDQLLDDPRLVAELEPYSTGLEMMQKSDKGVLGGYVNYDVCLGMIQIEREAKDSKCAACSKTPERPVKLTECGHFYCHDCYLDMVKTPVMTEVGYVLPTCSFSQCGQPLVVTKHSHSMESEVWQASQNSKFKEPGVDFNKVFLPRPNERNGCFLLGHHKEDVPHIPSSRLTVAMCVLVSWALDYPQDKILVFTQFVSTAKVLGLMLEKMGIPFLYYYGCMSEGKKRQALEIFQGGRGLCPKVMLVSLRAGGQSLNLACANRVIIIEPWWNCTAEQQAIGRAHRIGQNKECHVVRVLTDADMDTKLINLQVVKRKEVDYALQDDGHVPVLLDDAQREEIFDFTTCMEMGSGEQTSGRRGRRGLKRRRVL